MAKQAAMQIAKHVAKKLVVEASCFLLDMIFGAPDLFWEHFF